MYMAHLQSLGLESYITGPPPRFVSVRAEPLSWVVSVHNRRVKATVAGYFGNPRESGGFEVMPLPISDDGDLSGLEVRVLCVLPEKDGNVTALEQTGGETTLNYQHIVTVYEVLGVPTKKVGFRYARGSKLISVNMAKGTLTRGNLTGEVWRPPEPNETESYDPPEPNDPRFWKLMAARRRRQ